jgi:hypothetical protein
MAPVEARTTPHMWDDGEMGSLGDAPEGLPTTVYSEEAFRYFLDVERNRLERSQRSSLLVLVRLLRRRDVDLHMDGATATRVFAGLSQCVREVDFVGWYREGRVAAAVLAQGTAVPDVEASQRIGQRINRVIAEQLPDNVARHVRVRLVHLRPARKS